MNRVSHHFLNMPPSIRERYISSHPLTIFIVCMYVCVCVCVCVCVYVCELEDNKEITKTRCYVVNAVLKQMDKVLR